MTHYDETYTMAFPRLAGRRARDTVSTCPACGRFTAPINDICPTGHILYSCITWRWSIAHITDMRRMCGGPVLRRVPRS